MKYFSGHFASNHETPAKHQKSSQPQTAKLTTLKINSAGSSGDFEGLKFSLSYRSWICMGTRESKCSLCPLGRENQEAGNKMVCGHIPFVLQLLTAVKLHFLSTELSHQNISHFEFDPSRKNCPLIKKKDCDLKEKGRAIWNTKQKAICAVTFLLDVVVTAGTMRIDSCGICAGLPRGTGPYDQLSYISHFIGFLHEKYTVVICLLECAPTSHVSLYASVCVLPDELVSIVSTCNLLADLSRFLSVTFMSSLLLQAF